MRSPRHEELQRTIIFMRNLVWTRTWMFFRCAFIKELLTESQDLPLVLVVLISAYCVSTIQKRADPRELSRSIACQQ